MKDSTLAKQTKSIQCMQLYRVQYQRNTQHCLSYHHGIRRRNVITHIFQWTLLHGILHCWRNHIIACCFLLYMLLYLRTCSLVLVFIVVVKYVCTVGGSLLYCVVFVSRNLEGQRKEKICCHQSRDIPTPGFPKLPRDREKHIPGVVFGSSICWA